ncbi:hypothetical protein B566_EDAN017205 [Ephemera danica]|nr:hypothetical protein B566_EDAN017205 [Ephemera danica]
MGNVLASSKQPLAPPLQQPVEPNLLNSQETEVTKVEPPPALDMNPGPMDDIHKRAKEVFPMAFEGARFVVNKALSGHFQVCHSLNMSTSNPAQSGYKFGVTFVGQKQVGPGEAYPILIGDVDANGNVNANAIHLFNKNVLGKLMYRVQGNKIVAMQTSLDYRGHDFTASITGANVDLVNYSGSLDSNWTASAVIEKKLQPLPFTLSLSGTLNQKSHQFRLGLGFIIG